jgi:hypothetical protein
LVRASTGCQTAESFPAYRFTQDQHQSIVYRMRMAERGAQVSSAAPESRQERSLGRIPGQVSVNQATANEIEARLGLTASEAEAMVA